MAEIIEHIREPVYVDSHGSPEAPSFHAHGNSCTQRDQRLGCKRRGLAPNNLTPQKTVSFEFLSLNHVESALVKIGSDGSEAQGAPGVQHFSVVGSTMLLATELSSRGWIADVASDSEAG